MTEKTEGDIKKTQTQSVGSKVERREKKLQRKEQLAWRSYSLIVSGDGGGNQPEVHTKSSVAKRGWGRSDKQTGVEMQK